MKAVITVYDDNDNIIVKDKWLAPRCSEVDGRGAYAIIKDQFEFNVIREVPKENIYDRDILLQVIQKDEFNPSFLRKYQGKPIKEEKHE